MAVLVLVLGIGVPRMSDWLLASRAQSAAGFYAEGFALARGQAVLHNSASRLVLTENPKNGQMNWQVDICFPTPSEPCNGESGSWSSTTGPAGDDPQGATGFKSVFRNAGSLPASDVLAQTLSPSGATDVYFTPLGWVDTTFAPRLVRIGLAPSRSRSGAFPALAVVLTLAGIATTCDPNAAPHSARGCPP